MKEIFRCKQHIYIYLHQLKLTLVRIRQAIGYKYISYTFMQVERFGGTFEIVPLEQCCHRLWVLVSCKSPLGRSI